MDWMSFGIGLLLMAVVAGIGILLQWRNWSAAKEAREAEFNRQQQELQGQLTQEKALAANLEGQLGELTRLRDERAAALEQLDAQRQETTNLLGKLQSLETQIQERERAFQEQRDLLVATEAKLREAFENLAQDAVQKSQTAFLELADTKFKQLNSTQVQDLEDRKKSIEATLKPLQERLGELKQFNEQIEKQRVGAYASLQTLLGEMQNNQRDLQSETRKLATALKNPTTRGQWGELQLRRVIELAGMLKYCDFREQVHMRDEDGAARPDVVIDLPNQRQVIIDSKVPLAAYLEAIETEDEVVRQERYQQHAVRLRSHLDQLGKKDYNKFLKRTPDFVLMFVPAESIYSAALTTDPQLLEHAMKNGVLIATPTSLIGILRSIEAGWREQELAKNARRALKLTTDLHDRLRVFAEHLQKVGKNLSGAVTSYNKAVGTLEARVLPSTRQIGDLARKAEKDWIPELQPLESLPRTVDSGNSAIVEADHLALDMFGDDDVVEVTETTEEEAEASENLID